ncbi:MAG: hypothetical protein A3F41_04835 [Coxiella sp. RIFCSPHIGHO2_12_FULL_44_14]|nr:MAG: hypothetical protein A3F41_04835 [Coxiella sp. RIFCSPHIGHO2_12_FULL_44_14]
MQSIRYCFLLSCALLSMVAGLIYFFIYNASFNTPLWLFSAMVVWNVLAIFFLILTYRCYRVGFLLAMLAIVLILRSLGVNQLYALTLPSLSALLFMILLFFCMVYEDQKKRSLPLSLLEWQLTFIRLLFGLNLAAHCAEKLFAGPAPFHRDVLDFIYLGVPHPEYMVFLAGLLELGGLISLSLGFLTRLGAIGTALYLIVATVLGHHFSSGYIWASTGGGWEYPMLWILLILSFAVVGAGTFSVDAAIQARCHVPQWIRRLMG